MNAITVICLVLGAKELTRYFALLLEWGTGEKLWPRWR